MSTKVQTLAAWLESEPKETRKKYLLPIFQTDRPRFQPKHLVELSRLLDITSPQEEKMHEPQHKDDVHFLQIGEKVLVLYEKSGAFFFADHSKLNRIEYRPDLPSLDAAAKIAKEYLRKRGLLPENAVLDGAKVVNFEIAQGAKHLEQSQVANHIVVDFRLKFGDLETYGPGEKIKVLIGHKGEIVGLLHAVRQAHRFAELQPTPRSILAPILKRKLGTALEKIKVLDARLALSAESFTADVRFLQPAYILTLESAIASKRYDKPVTIRFMTHPLPATEFGPHVTIEAPASSKRLYIGQPLKLACKIQGGTKPYRVNWYSNIDGLLSDEPLLETKRLSVAHRQNKVGMHTIRVVVTDANGFQDSHQIMVKIMPKSGLPLSTDRSQPPLDPADPYVGVEWCNLYHGSAPDISGTTESAQGFKNGLSALSGWSSRFDWGNDDAWEEDFKCSSAPGGGTDSYWSDNVHIAFFAGHGSSGAFYFGSTADDHQMAAADARWGDGILNWIVLHACNTMMNNFNWTVWCDSFIGLHQMFGFHTTTEGSNPPLGSRFAFWSSFPLIVPWLTGFNLQTAWGLACSECFDSSVEYSVIYANQNGTDTQNDHLPGFGYVSPDPTNPTSWCYFKHSC